MASNDSTSKTHNTTIITVKRAMGISKTYIIIALVFTILALTVWSPYSYSSLVSAVLNSTANTTANTLSTIASNSVKSATASKNGLGYGLLAVPLDCIPAVMLATPVLLLFVYDKNNGVLEYLLSLGLGAREIYMRYLKAVLLLVITYVVVFSAISFTLAYVSHGMQIAVLLLPVHILSSALAISVVSFMLTAMMIFSSLQKTRAGGNQPFALFLGWLCTAPAYLFALIFTGNTGLYADGALIAVIAIIASALLISSGKLIKKEKLLP